MAAPTGSVEISVDLGGWGGDVLLDPLTADLLLVQDTAGSPVATKQRLTRGMRTNPRPRDLNNNAIGVPDDLVHPDYGMGLGAAVGESLRPALANGIKARGLAMLDADPYVALTPTPTVTTTQNGATLSVSVSAVTVLGDPIVITKLPISGV